MRNNHFDYRYDQAEQKSEWSTLHMVFGGLIMLVFFVCLWFGAQNKNDPTGEKQLALYPYKDTSQLVLKIKELEAAMPVKAEPEQFYTWLAQMRIAEDAIESFSRYGLMPTETAASLSERMQDIEKRGGKAAEISRFSMETTSLAQEQFFSPAISAAKVPIDRTPIWQSLAVAYLISCALMLLMMCYKAKKKGYNLIGEALSLTRLPLATPTWLFTAWRYPFGTPVRSLQKALEFAGYTLALVLSVGAAGGAKAFGQSGSKQNGKGKATADWTIQTDARYGEIVAGAGPNPQRQLRVTITSPTGWMSENIFGSNNLSWNALVTGGKRFLKTKHTTLIGVAGFRQTHDKVRGTDSTSVVGGLQVFNAFSLPKRFPGFSAIATNTPVINFERTVRGSPGNRHLNITVVNQTFAKAKLKDRLGGLFPGWETVLSKTATKPLAWTTGPLLEYKFPRKNWPRVGIGYLWNQSGAGVLRFRLIETFSF